MEHVPKFFYYQNLLSANNQDILKVTRCFFSGAHMILLDITRQRALEDSYVI